jgi:uncharacterized membrane protein
MKSRKELKQQAKSALKGKWGSAIILNIVPIISTIIVFFVMIGLTVAIAFFVGQGLDDSANLSNNFTKYFSEGTSGGTGIGIGRNAISTIFGFYASVAVLWGSLKLIRKPDEPLQPLEEVKGMFKGESFLAILINNVIVSVFTVLWTLLFIVPGFVKSYAYSMSNYILKDMIEENDGTRPKATEPITKSRELMNGNKGRLFVLDLSFIPWHLLAFLTVGIGYIWLYPYIETTRAAFYQDLVDNPKA